ncbi:hypothetical protein [Fictibacillus gelatini]|nr:hypothetical protein [Fictibacillus gelatini]
MEPIIAMPIPAFAGVLVLSLKKTKVPAMTKTGCNAIRMVELATVV